MYEDISRPDEQPLDDDGDQTFVRALQRASEQVPFNTVVRKALVKRDVDHLLERNALAMIAYHRENIGEQRLAKITRVLTRLQDRIRDAFAKIDEDTP